MSPSEALLNEIRASRPVAPTELRDRVRAIAAERPASEPFLARVSLRRLVLVAPATVLVALLAAGAIAVLPREGTGDERAASGGAATTTATQALDSATPETLRKASPSAPSASAPSATLSVPLRGSPGSAIAPTPGRLQRFDAEMRLRVEGLDDLSTATKRAMRVAQSLGGYVASVQYDAPAQGIGGAQLVLRVPTARVQTAIVQLSALGTILGQRIGIEDLQQSANDLTDQIVDTQRRIAQLRRQLKNTSLLDEERAVLQARLTEARRQLTDLQTTLRGTRAEASLATIQLSLTTERLEAAPADKGRLDDLKTILAWEGAALLYALVVAGPFVLLGLIVWLALRFRRRREETRLLAQT
jgi:uncharacterized protein DUF4349